MKILAITTVCVTALLVSSTAVRVSAGEAAQAAKAVPSAKAAKPAPATARDPMCGMSVDTAKAKEAGRTSVVDGNTFYFCNDSCKKEFDAAPAKFAAQAASGAAAGSMKDGCCDCCGHKAADAKAAAKPNAHAGGGMCGRRMH